MRSAKGLAVALACLLVAACAMQAMDADQAAHYRRVGVLVAMGNRFSDGAVGATVFGNQYKAEELDVGIDDLLAAKVRQALAARYTVVDLTRYRDAFMKEPKYWPGQERIVGEDRPSAGEVVRRLMGTEKLDAYVLVTPAGASVVGTNQGVGGVGIIKLQRVFGSDEFRLHAAYIVSVVDGKTYSIVADMRATALGEPAVPVLTFERSPINAPSVPVAPQLWQAPSDHKDEIRTLLAQLLDKSVPETLRRANLTN